jgi:hypothetical protein
VQNKENSGLSLTYPLLPSYPYDLPYTTPNPDLACSHRIFNLIPSRFPGSGSQIGVSWMGVFRSGR